MTKNSAQKNTLTYTLAIHTDLTQVMQEISITIASSPFGKLRLQNQFHLCSSMVSFQCILHQLKKF